MAYETERSRRLRLELAGRRRNMWRVLGFFVTLVVLIVVTGIIIYIGRQNLSSRLDGANGVEQEVTEDAGSNNQSSGDITITAPASDIGVILSAELPSKLAKINSQLGIEVRTDLTNLPNHTSTAVVVIDLSGRDHSSVAYNADVQFTSASTYKIFVAYAMIHDVETGRRTWTSNINGLTWDTCLTKTIVNSDNACPEAYLASIGYDKFNEIVRGLGVSDQTVFYPYYMRTTANDLALVLQKLYRGELMSDENKNKLLDLMSRQIYRQGIPTGVGDSGIVYDKVGFLDELLHDAAIVHTDQGDYIMVIMTNGESWGYIAEVAQYINSMLGSG